MKLHGAPLVRVTFPVDDPCLLMEDQHITAVCENGSTIYLINLAELDVYYASDKMAQIADSNTYWPVAEPLLQLSPEGLTSINWWRYRIEWWGGRVMVVNYCKTLTPAGDIETAFATLVVGTVLYPQVRCEIL